MRDDEIDRQTHTHRRTSSDLSINTNTWLQYIKQSNRDQ